MSYKFDAKLIHDHDAMWDLALSFKIHYEYIKEQVEQAQRERPYNSITHEGKIIMPWEDEYKKILSDYKSELKFMDNFLSFNLKLENNKIKPYIEEESE